MNSMTVAGLSAPSPRSALICGAAALGLAAAVSLPSTAMAQCLDASNATDFVRVEDHPDLVPQTGLTVEAWCVWDGVGFFPTLVRKDPAPFAESYLLRIESGRPQWNLFDVNGVRTLVYPNVTMPTGTPVHLAGTWDGVEAKLYMDGVEIATVPARPTLLASSGPLLIGAGDGPTNIFRGQIDEVRIWDHARSAAQITAGLSRELDCRNGQVATWHFDGDLLDAFGRLDGTAVGAPAQFAPEFAPFDRALQLGGGSSGGHVAVAAAPELVPANGLTVEAWVVWDGVGVFPTIVRKNPAAFMESYMLRVEAGRPEWITFDPNGVRTLCFPSTRMPIGQPTHLAGTWDGVESKLYMNGDLLLTVPSRPGLLMSGGELRIGAGDGPLGNFGGAIDEVRIWERARSAEEIRSMMLETVRAGSADLVAAWQFDGDLTEVGGRFGGQAVATVDFEDEFVPFGCDNSVCFDPDLGSALQMGDDDLDSIPLPFALPVPGGGVSSSIDVSSNGFVWFTSAPGNHSRFIPSVPDFVGNAPRVAPMWRDINPADALSDDVYVRVETDRVVVTWHECVTFQGTRPFTLQVQLFDDGSIRTYVDAAHPAEDLRSVIFGVSAGGGVDPGSTDVTSAPMLSSGSVPTLYEEFAAGSGVDLRDVSFDFTPNGAGGYDLSVACLGRAGVARTESFGVGCPAASPLTLSAIDGARPWVGRRALPVEITGLPAGAAAGVLHIGFDPLNVDLSIIGMQGCAFYVPPVVAKQVLISGGVARSTLPVLSNPSLVGAVLYAQALALPSSATTLGIVSSNRLELVHGNF